MRASAAAAAADVADVESCPRRHSARLGEPSVLARAKGPATMTARATGHAASPRLAACCSSKEGLLQLIPPLGGEWAARRARVSAVSPGNVETKLTGCVLRGNVARKEIITRTQLGGLATVDRIVAPTLFPASDEASHVTSTSLLVDVEMAA